MGENIIKRIVCYVMRNTVLQTACHFLSEAAWILLFLALVSLIGYTFAFAGIIYISSAIIISIVNFFLWLPASLLFSRLAADMKPYRALKTAAFFVALCLPQLLMYHTAILVKDSKLHIGEKADTNISDSLRLVNIINRMGFSNNLPIERVATFSEIDGERRLTRLYFEAREFGQYMGYHHIYLFNQTSIFEEICYFSELRELYLEGYSHKYSPYSLGQIPKEISQLKKLRILRISSYNMDTIPREVEDMKRLDVCSVHISRREKGNVFTPLMDWLGLVLVRKRE